MEGRTVTYSEALPGRLSEAVGGLTLEQAIRTLEYDAPLIIDADAFKTASGNLEESLRMICQKVHAFGDVKVGKR